MTQLTETVERLYAAFAAGDTDEMERVTARSLVWYQAENGPYAAGNPYRGPRAVQDGVFRRLAEEWDGFSETVETMIAEPQQGKGGRVAASGRYRGVYRETGRRLDAPFVHLWRIENGLVTRFRQYTDTCRFAHVMQA